MVDPPVDTYATTGDTGPAPACATPELEPNNGTAEATPLPFEQPGCGELDVADRDVFAFDMVDPGWLVVEVERVDGSQADLQLVVEGPDGLRVEKFDDTESTDVTLKFEAVAGPHFVTITEENGQGGKRYGYEVLVSEAKAPVEWTRLESEPNNSSDEAELLNDREVSIYGTFDGNAELADRDWFEIQIPGGEHALAIDVDAFSFGAAGDVKVEVRDLDNGLLRQFIDRNVGGRRENDPQGTYLSPGDETIRLQVVEEDDIEGAANWYVIHLALEAR